MKDAETGQVSTDAAEIYDAFFVPALFAQFAVPAAEAAELEPGAAGLDVACGTGVLAREMHRRGARVTGLDRNPGMLSVARRIGPAIDWREGRAEALPFADASFEAVGCSFGLMFFEDRVVALSEMARVLRPGGRLVVATWDAVERSPGYSAMISLLDRLFGSKVADALRAPFALGDRDALAELLAAAGVKGARIETKMGTARFPSIEAWVRTDVKGWTLADMIDDEQYRTLLAAAEIDLARFAAPDGAVTFDAPAHLALANKQSAP